MTEILSENKICNEIYHSLRHVCDKYCILEFKMAVIGPLLQNVQCGWEKKNHKGEHDLTIKACNCDV